jgi:uncharacterized membrane protein
MNFFPYHYGYKEIMRKEKNMKNNAQMQTMMKMMMDHMKTTQEIKELVNEMNDRLKFLEKNTKTIMNKGGYNAFL